MNSLCQLEQYQCQEKKPLINLRAETIKLASTRHSKCRLNTGTEPAIFLSASICRIKLFLCCSFNRTLCLTYDAFMYKVIKLAGVKLINLFTSTNLHAIFLGVDKNPEFSHFLIRYFTLKQDLFHAQCQACTTSIR